MSFSLGVLHHFLRSRVMKTLIRPRWVALFISLGLTALAYGGIRACDWLNHRLPNGDPKSFFGYFDGLAASCYCLWATGVALSGVCFLYIAVAAVYSCVCRLSRQHNSARCEL